MPSALAQLASLTTTADPTEARLEQIRPDPQQVRKLFDDAGLAELAQTIKHHGVLAPLIVKPAGPDGVHPLISGERRFRALQILSPDERPAMVPIRVVHSNDVLTLQLLENLQRQDLEEMELATALARQRDELGRSATEIAELLGKPVSWVSRYLSLLAIGEPARQALDQALVQGADSALAFNTLPEETQRELLEAGKPLPRAELRHLQVQHEAQRAPQRLGRPRTPKAPPAAPSAPPEAPAPAPAARRKAPAEVTLVLPRPSLRKLFEALAIDLPKDDDAILPALLERLSK